MKSDVTIIGGGPAGSATAIHLVRGGKRVRLYEKTHFPRAKLCGGFISAEGLPELKDLGVLDALRQSGASPVRKVILASPGGAEAGGDFPVPGLSVSRQCVDNLLLMKAREAGVDVIEGTDGLAHSQEGQCTIMACGRSPLPTLSLKGEGSHRASLYYGLQAYFANVEGITDQVELDMIPGGYVGLNRQEEELINVCALISQKNFHPGANIDDLFREFMTMNPNLNGHMATAHRVSPWLAVGPVSMGLRQLVTGNRFYVGDAACVVDPFVGEGMAMALIGARLLSHALLRHEKTAAASYAKSWHHLFDQPLWLQSWLRRAVQSSLLQELIVSGTRKFPPLLGWLRDRTRATIPIDSNACHLI